MSKVIRQDQRVGKLGSLSMQMREPMVAALKMKGPL